MTPLSTVTDPRIVKALAHPLRVQILRALERRTASPNELAAELGAPLGNVSYHVRQLASAGLLTLVRETPRRGAVEHYYRLEAAPGIDGQAWADAPKVVKTAVVAGALAQIGEEVVAAAGQGGFDGSESHLDRVALTLDAEGFAAAAHELEAMAAKLRAIAAASAERLAAGHGDQHELPVLAVTMLLEASEPVG